MPPVREHRTDLSKTGTPNPLIGTGQPCILIIRRFAVENVGEICFLFILMILETKRFDVFQPSWSIFDALHGICIKEAFARDPKGLGIIRC